MTFRNIPIAIIGLSIVLGGDLSQRASAQDNPQTEMPTIIRKSGGVFAGSAIKRVEPIYPADANVTGAVTVEVILDENGDVTSAKALSGHPLLTGAALVAARQWKFAPTKLAGTAVKVIGTLTFNFSPPNGASRADTAGDDDLEKAKQAVKTNAYSPEAHFKLAEAYVDERLFDQAIDSFKRAIELKSSYREAYLGLANVYQRQGKRDDEIELYRQALIALPKDVTLLETTSRAMNDTERYAEAIDVQKRVVQIKPDDLAAQINLGLYHFRARRFPESINAFQEALRINPKYALAYHNIGAVYVNQGRYEDAIEAYNQALKVDPGYYQAYKLHVDLGTALLRSRGSEEAIEEFKRGIEINPRYAPAHYDIATAYHNLGRYDDAIESLKKAIALQPRTSTYHYMLGEVRQHLGVLAEAEAELREAVKLAPDFAQGQLALASVLFLENKFDEADKIVRQAVPLMPKNMNGYALVSNLLQHQGHALEAEAALKKALEMDPNNALALNNFGYILVERNERLEEALGMIQRAVKAEPKNASYLDSLGWTYFKLEKFEEAERYLAEAAQFGQSPVILDHLGDTFQKRGKVAQARDVWQKALALRAGPQLTARIKAKLSALGEK